MRRVEAWAYRGKDERVVVGIVGGYVQHPGDAVNIALRKVTPRPRREWAYVVVDTPMGQYEGELALTPVAGNAEVSDTFGFVIPDPLVLGDGTEVRRTHVATEGPPPSARLTVTVVLELDGEDLVLDAPLEVRPYVVPPPDHPEAPLYAPPPPRRLHLFREARLLAPDELAELYKE